MKILITGANGFIGSAVLKLLLNKGYEVRAMVRKGSDKRNFSNLNTEVIEADLLDQPSLKRAVKGCDHLFHIAADYRLWIPDPKNMYKTNVDGTKALMMAALEQSISKIVYTSSVAVLGVHDDGTPADETTPSTLDDMQGHYKRSKYLAEESVKEIIKKESAPITIVNPSTPVGPGDIKPTPTGLIVLDTIQQRMPAYVDTGLNIVHVDDVAEGHLLAMEKGEIGERYILGGDNMTLASILEFICLHEDIDPPSIQLPHNLIIPIAWCMERIAAITGKSTRITVDSVLMAKKKMYFTSEKAKTILGYNPRAGTKGLIDAINWFKEHDYQ